MRRPRKPQARRHRPGLLLRTRTQEERTQCLWQALERAIPDVRARTRVELAGTPLTHERFLRRARGSYGPAISAATGSFPGPRTDVPGLFRRAPVGFCLCMCVRACLPLVGPGTFHLAGSASAVPAGGPDGRRCRTLLGPHCS
jgi:hypothetical protein